MSHVETAPTATAQLTGREYLRVSFDTSGEERSPREQHEENEVVADGFGIALGVPYKDVGSASRFAKKVRDGFVQLMADLEADTFGADVLQMWEGSRGSRKPREWLDLIDVCQQRGIKILITTENRLYDLANWRDRQRLKEDAIKAESESEQTRERVMRGLNANVRNGRPHGPVPYGYRRTYRNVRNPNGRSVRKPDQQLPEPAEALNVIDLLQQIDAGRTMAAIERDWAARGIVSRNGVPFSAQTLRQTALKLCHIGKREHHGQVVNAAWPVVADFEGSPMSAEEFVDLFHRVRSVLKDPKRVTTTGGPARHAYSMTLRCDACGGPMTVSFSPPMATPDDPYYACRDRGCTRINKADVDGILTAEICAKLARPDVYAAISSTPGDGRELAVVRSDLSTRRARLAAFEAEDPETPAEARLIGRTIERLEAEIRELVAHEAELTRPNPLAELFEPGQDVERRWEATQVPAQRAIAALLLSPAMLGQVRVVPAAKRGLPAAERLVWYTTE
ncbi:recombinase family protein [Actinacidiphila glaucinigra]|uniref:recombinase family protein n=1 Tax=Actinacidiphila glaucinigra TaxID=235986 RepID=UPI002DD80400|nr:recombinase family protein [Actinacidiphila glaucinigra]WSD58982.1 recombinase family protein [Actinacidiphila glaucinigra]